MGTWKVAVKDLAISESRSASSPGFSSAPVGFSLGPAALREVAANEGPPAAAAAAAVRGVADRVVGVRAVAGSSGSGGWKLGAACCAWAGPE